MNALTDPAYLVTGLLIFVRILGVITASPVLGHLHVPSPVKVSLGVVVACVMLPLVPVVEPSAWSDLGHLAGAAVREMVVGVLIGFSATLLFVAIQLAGEMIDFQMGFGMAAVLDPLLGTQVAVMAQVQYVLATLLFLIGNGHHHVLLALSRSFEIVPVATADLTTGLDGRLIEALSALFVLGLRIGAPVMVAIILTELTLGLLGRSMPQMNLLMVGFPIKIMVGMLVMIASLPFFVPAIRGLFDGILGEALRMLRAL